MRPLVLKIKGLRSYREETILDFSDRALVAIIGDTGAGKSSILEAITYALYGGATWSRGVVKDLIGSNEPAMSVEFTFRADDANWLVKRSARSNTGQGLHLLVCQDDKTRQFDGASAVNAEIQRLVGLDYDGFLRAVILPQGKFQELLQSTPSQRNGVLKGIFRVDEIEAVREHARNGRDRLSVALNEAKVARAGLLPDPWSVADEATALAATSRDALARLEAAAAEIAAAESDVRDATGRIAILQSDVADITRARRPGDAAALEQLLAVESALAVRMEAAAARQSAHEAEAEAIATELASADSEGVGERGLTHALATLENANRELRRLSTVRRQLDEDRATIAESEAALPALESASDIAASGFLLARAALTAAESADTAARERQAAARAALRDVRQAYTRAAEASAALTALRTTLADREAALADSRASLAVASAAHESARAAFEEASRHSHAAAAAAGHGPGDPCPVCARKLPAGFTPPISESDAEARSALDLATAAEQSARALVARAEALFHEAEAREPAIIAASEASLAAFDSANAALALVVPSADLSLPDPDLLSPLDLALSSATAALRSARLATEEAQKASTAAAASLATATSDLARRTKALADETQRFDHDRAELQQSLKDLPQELRPPSPATATGIADAIAAITARMDALRARDAERRAALAAARDAQREQEALRQELESTVRRPLAEFANAHAALSQCLATVANHIAAAAAAIPFPSALAEAIAAVQALDATAAELIDTCTARVTAEQARLAAAGHRVTAALEQARCESPDHLRSTTVTTAATLQRVEAELAMALRQQPLATELDSRIEGGTSLFAGFDVVYSHLSDAKFIDYVIRERQKILLVVASEILGPMTNNRYGFADDFRVVDRWSGQPREVKTLSGGETFLASLALALALVELASRGGGRLEALFLDEGFGSLDANTLPEALKALEKQASGGRLVAVISHLRAVAESIDHVLHVTRDPSGSRATWLTPQEREALLSADAGSGLLD